MKRFLLCLSVALLLLTGGTFAQQIESLAGNKGKVRVGGYGAPTIKYTTFDKKSALILGGNAGVMLNSQLMLGAGGYALVNNIEAPRTNAGDPTLYWNMWYAGFVPEYTIRSNKLFHLAVGALIGGGGVMKSERYHGGGFDDDYEPQDYSSFFVGEPHVTFEMNITSYLRIGVGGSYRFVQGSSTPGITDDRLSGPAAHFTIKAGRF
ncbi:hypothetical protein ACWKWU_20415 [Chitinophaga lutea]